MENKRINLQKPVTEKLKSWLTILHKETRKIKICKNDLGVFTLRNYLAGYKLNKSLSGLLV